MKQPWIINPLRPNGQHFADDNFKRIFFNENVWISIKISLKFGSNQQYTSIQIQKMAWRRPGYKPSSEPMMVSLSTHICVTRPQWANMGNLIIAIPMGIHNTLHWRHNDHEGVLNHQPHGCLLNRLFRRKSKKTSKLRVTGLCVGNSPGPVNSPHKGPVTRKILPYDDVIMKPQHNKAQENLVHITYTLYVVISTFVWITAKPVCNDHFYLFSNVF